MSIDTTNHGPNQEAAGGVSQALNGNNGIVAIEDRNQEVTGSSAMHYSYWITSLGTPVCGSRIGHCLKI